MNKKLCELQGYFLELHQICVNFTRLTLPSKISTHEKMNFTRFSSTVIYSPILYWNQNTYSINCTPPPTPPPTPPTPPPELLHHPDSAYGI